VKPGVLLKIKMGQISQDFSRHSDRDLEKCVRLRSRYDPKDVESAVEELERRGRIFSLSEITAIDKDLRRMRKETTEAAINQESDRSFKSLGLWAKKDNTRSGNTEGMDPSEFSSKKSLAHEAYPLNVIDTLDSNAPSYYNPLAVSLFSLLFGTIYGVVLMVINFSKTNNKQAILEVILFGLLFLLAQNKVLSYFPMKDLMIIGLVGLLVNGFGAAILYLLFWRRFIGDTKAYKSKPFGQMLLISLVVAFAFATFILSMGVKLGRL